MKKIRVDFVAHYSVVVAINECEDMYDKAVELAESYIENSPSIRPSWEVEGDGVDIADKTKQIKAALERVLTIHTEMPIPQRRIDEYEEILKQKDALKTYVTQEELEDRKFQKEQMKQRSRYLSKHCGK